MGKNLTTTAFGCDLSSAPKPEFPCGDFTPAPTLLPAAAFGGEIISHLIFPRTTLPKFIRKAKVEL